MSYNYAWLLSASYVDLSLTNAIFQVSVAAWTQQSSNRAVQGIGLCMQRAVVFRGQVKRNIMGTLAKPARSFKYVKGF